MASVPFDAIEPLSTPETIKIAREIIAAPNDVIASGRLSEMVVREVGSARASLWNAARNWLAPYLVFAGSGGVRELLALLLGKPDVDLTRRNSRAGDRERHLLLFIQRITAKNDTFSRFGPTSWGRVERDENGITIDVLPGIRAQEAFLERWTAHAVADVINSEITDANIRVPALEPHAFEILCEDVEKWQAGAARERWISILRSIAALPKKFVAAVDTSDRQSILDEARERLGAVGAVRTRTDRFLYAATNPIGEECFRKSNFSIPQSSIDELVEDSSPWIDLFRDTYAFVASRVAATLRQIMERAGGKSGAIPLPVFLKTCEVARLPLTGPGLIAPAVIAFQEVKAAFADRLRRHLDLNEYELTADDCHVVRNNFEYSKFDEYTYPSADLQIAAESTQALARGDYQWLLAELHPAAALLQHCMYWACPDKPVLNAAIARTTLGRPNFHFGFFAADFTAHTCVHLFDALPDLTSFVAPQRSNPKWRTISPAETEVYADQNTGDVCLRKIDSREYLGSFARAWVIPLGFHPFQFGMAPHTPRLHCGKVIVQRRTWTVTIEEFGSGDFKGVSSDLVLAVENLRARRDLPRYIYIRPTEQALRRSGAEGRDKDTKPVFVDLESYLFLEIFYRWLIKAGELEVTEMLPDPDHLLWKEPDGRHTFELRTLIVPRE